MSLSSLYRINPERPHYIILFLTWTLQAFDAARLEEEFNVERWGLIEGGHDMDRTNTNLTLTAASTLLWLRKTKLPTKKSNSRKS